MVHLWRRQSSCLEAPCWRQLAAQKSGKPAPLLARLSPHLRALIGVLPYLQKAESMTGLAEALLSQQYPARSISMSLFMIAI